MGDGKGRGDCWRVLEMILSDEMGWVFGEGLEIWEGRGLRGRGKGEGGWMFGDDLSGCGS